MQKHTQNPYPLPKTSEPLVNQTHKLSNKPISNKLSSDLQLRRIGFFAKGWERERERERERENFGVLIWDFGVSKGFFFI